MLRAALRSSPAAARPLRVFAMGNTIMDTMLTMPKMPIDDKLWIDSKITYVGGQGANAAQGMARLGLQVSFMTRLGEDMDGRFARDHYRELGMRTEHCIMVPGALTMSACVTVETSTSQRSCLMHRDPSMFDFCTREAVERAREDLGNYDVLYTDGHQLDLVLPLARRAAELGLPVLADMEVLDDQALELVDLSTKLIAPARVIRELASEGDLRKAVKALAARSPGRVVVATAGAEGSYGAKHGDTEAVYVVPWQASNKGADFTVRDTTGCGDAYHAGYIVANSRGIHDLCEAMTFATAVAAAKAETPGPVVSHESLVKFGLVAE